MRYNLRVPRNVDFGWIVPLADTLVPQFTHKDLKGEKSEDAQAEDDEGHDLQKLAHGFEQGVDDRLQAYLNE